MMLVWLKVVHIAVLGYWLGAELVINSSYRYVAFRDDLPFAERSRLMEQVMDVDQHVRYALALQAGIGVALAAAYGFIPGGDSLLLAALLFTAAWLGFIELTHRLRHHPGGPVLAALDRGSRYLLLGAFALIALGWLGSDWPLPGWLRWKLGLFAGVMACGVAIRLALVEHFRTWARMSRSGPDPAGNALIRRTCIRATTILVVLWLLIGLMVFFSVQKP